MKKAFLNFLTAFLLLCALTTQAASFSLGTTSLVETSAAGSDSVLLLTATSSTAWTATTNATYSWLHLNMTNGIGSTNIFFTFDLNYGPTRTGSLNIAGIILTVTQAGPSYIPASLVTNLVSTGLTTPAGVAADNAGNVYIADYGHNAIKKWTLTNNTVTTLVTSNTSTPIYKPEDLALDSAGNVYFVDSGNNAIKKWTVSSSTLSTVISSNATTPLSLPGGIALDSVGNIYIADTLNNAVKKWNGSTLSTLVATGLNNPIGVAVDAVGNVYIADALNSAIKRWNVANSEVTPVVTNGLVNPFGVSVDGSGNLYIADTANNAIKKWTAVNSNVTTLVSNLNGPYRAEVDNNGNLYIADTGNNSVKAMPDALVDTSTVSERPLAGSDHLPAVLPTTQNLTSVYAPSSDSAWLTTNGVTNGQVYFSFTANSGTQRIGNITVLGKKVPVVQAIPTYVLGMTNLVVGANAGSEIVLVSANTNWTVSQNASWLHLAGTGISSFSFNYDANTGATRTGYYFLGDQTLTITQVGTNYVAANAVYTLVTNVTTPVGVGVDRAGNVYYSDAATDALYQLTPGGAVSTITSKANMQGLGIDNAGNVFMAIRQASGYITKWTATNNTVTTIVTNAGLVRPDAVTVDAAGNLYIADTGNNAVKKWTAANNTITTLASDLSSPSGIAVDLTGNVYFADTGNNAIKKWAVADGSVTALVSSGLIGPDGVAVDGSGNVYILDGSHSLVKEWMAVSNSVVTLSAFSSPSSIAVDSARNLYEVDFLHAKSVSELTRAWVDPTAKSESAEAGIDSLVTILPATANLSGQFIPTSDASWLTITGTTNGIVSFAFTANLNPTFRTGHINLLGQSIAVTQIYRSALGSTNRLEGPDAGTDTLVVASAINWTATANAAWLHVNAGSQSGTGNTNITFTFDANPGTTRTGTFTIAGLTFTVTQAGTGYALSNPFTPMITNLSGPSGVAVDSAGNIYTSEIGNNLVRKWIAASNSLTTLVSGLGSPRGLVLDSAGNLFIADAGNNTIKKWSPVDQSVTTVISNNLAGPTGLVVDAADSLYIVDIGHNAIKKWSPADNTVSTLISGLSTPVGISVDAAGNVYWADAAINFIRKWNPISGIITNLVTTGLSTPQGVAVNGTGDVYFADTGNNAVDRWSALDGTVSTIAWPGNAALSSPGLIALSQSGDLYMIDSSRGRIDLKPRAFVNTNAFSEAPAAGTDTLTILPTTVTLTGALAPSSGATWLTVTGATNGVIGFSFAANTTLPRSTVLSVLGQNISVSQGAFNYTLGTTNLSVGPGAGSDSVMLRTTNAWTAVANDSWLHLSAANQSGPTSTNIIFTFDANAGSSRTGTINIGNQTLTVRQAGVTYVPTGTAAAAILVSSGLNNPSGLSADSAGNVYFADTLNNSVKKWSPTNNAVTMIVSSGLNHPTAAIPDAAGNVYILDTGNSAVKVWNAANSNVTSVVSSSLVSPQGMARDAFNNIYIADTGNNAIKVWNSSSNTLTTLLSSGLSSPQGVAVDLIGNIYIADKNNLAIKKWSAANSNVTTLVTYAVGPQGVAVDVSGNVYISYLDNSLQKWSAVSNNVTTLFAGGGIATGPGLAVDLERNVYFSFPAATAVVELPVAFVDAAGRTETAAGGSDSLLPVIPSIKNLQPPFFPTSDSPWLTITGATNGLVSFIYTGNSNAPRTGHITVLGQSVPVVQAIPSLALGLTNLLEGPAAGLDSVVLAANYDWTATAGASWLHINPSTQSGTGNTNVVFAFDSNPGATRTGTLTIAGMTVTVTQAGATYVAANPAASIVTGALSPSGVAVNAAGDVYYNDGSQIKVRTAGSGSINTVVSSGLSYPYGLALDTAGNLYIADVFTNAIKKWTATNNTLTTLISSGIDEPKTLAVDDLGNLYIGTGNLVVKWTAANGTLNTLASGFSDVPFVAVDRARNVYMADYSAHTVQVWHSDSQTVTILISGLAGLGSMAVDGSGNVYLTANSNGQLKKWNTVDGSWTTLISSGINIPSGLAVDQIGNVYVGEFSGNAVHEWVRAFVDPAAKNKTAKAGSDSLPVILPVTTSLLAPFAPTSDVPWLTITGTNNGILSFAYASTMTNRTGNISLLGQNIPVNQSGLPVISYSVVQTNSQLRFTFTNASGFNFNVLTSTNIALPLTNWTVLGTAMENPSGTYNFTNNVPFTNQSRFYIIQLP